MSDLSLQIAASGIDADEAELATAASNLSNITTPGYAEEVVNLETAPPTTPSGPSDGVIVSSISEDSSSLYDQINLSAQGQLGAANESASVQSAAQNAFPEPSSSGIAAQLSQLWADLSTLAADPSSQAAQGQLVNDASEVASSINGAYSQLSGVADQLSDDLQGGPVAGGGYLGQANGLITQIAQLNGEIVASGSNGSDLDSLLDERRSALNQLGTLLGISTTTQDNGAVNVSVGTIQLVAGSSATTLQATGSAATADLAVETASGDVVSAKGQIGALLTGVDTTIPTYQSQLSAVADSLATSLNALQSSGVSASGLPGPTSSAGASPYAGPWLPTIFVNNASATTYTTGTASAASIAVNPTLAADPSLIATAASSALAGQATNDPTTAQAMAAIGQAANGPDSIYETLVGLVGTQTAQANTNQSAAQALSDSTSAQVASVEGVDSNEESMNVLADQQTYQALAAVINSTTTALQSLIAAV